MEKVIILEIDVASHGRKIESVLQKEMGFSTTLIRRLKRIEGGIMLNGKQAIVIERLSCGDELKVTISGKECDNIIPVDLPINVLYEDEDIIAVNKPRSMPTHPSKDHQTDTLANRVVSYLGKDSSFHAITRLDNDTSGVVLIAKNPFAAAVLTEDIKNRKINKEYIAAVNGVPQPLCGKVSAPIKKKGESGIARCISPDGKEAITQYEVDRIFGEFSIVKLYPLTGRTHQLRVHMSYIGTPIYGDSMYGAPQLGEKTRLHCHTITFNHPISKRKTTISAPVPDDIYV